MELIKEVENAPYEIHTVFNKHHEVSLFFPISTSLLSQNTDNRPFAINDHMVQNLPSWRASSLLFPHWDIKTMMS